IRAVVPPLLASSLSLQIGARILALGDVTAPLRARIAAHQREAVELFSRAGIAGLAPASLHLPYLLSREDLSAPLAARGVTGKLHPVWSSGALAHLYRLSVPLDEARMERL